jgi:hypothetical protein
MPCDSAELESQGHVWPEGRARPAQAVDHQRILQALADRLPLGQGPLTCQEPTVLFRMDVAPTGGAAAVVGEASGYARPARRVGAGLVHACPGRRSRCPSGERKGRQRLSRITARNRSWSSPASGRAGVGRTHRSGPAAGSRRSSPAIDAVDGAADHCRPVAVSLRLSGSITRRCSRVEVPA